MNYSKFKVFHIHKVSYTSLTFHLELERRWQGKMIRMYYLLSDSNHFSHCSPLPSSLLFSLHLNREQCKRNKIIEHNMLMSCQKLDKHSSISGCKCICIWHVKNFNIQKVTLFILIYHFTTHLTSHFLFFTSYPTLFIYLFFQFFLFFLFSYAPYLSLFLKQPSNLQT